MTEKFIETECFLIDRQLEEMGISSQQSPVRVKFLNTSIESYRETIENGSTEVNRSEVLIYFKSGSSMIVNISYDELTKQL